MTQQSKRDPGTIQLSELLYSWNRHLELKLWSFTLTCTLSALNLSCALIRHKKIYYRIKTRKANSFISSFITPSHYLH